MIDQSNPWETISSKNIYENDWIEIIEDEVRNPNGQPGIYGKVLFKHLAIGIVTLDKDRNSWLVGQFRYPIGQYSWEITEGGGKLQLDPLASAKRELMEETGISADKWTKIQDLHISNSCTDEIGIIYVAQELTFGQSQPEEDEVLEVKKLPFDEVFGMAKNGEITDALSVVGIYKTKFLIDNNEL